MEDGKSVKFKSLGSPLSLVIYFGFFFLGSSIHKVFSCRGEEGGGFYETFEIKANFGYAMKFEYYLNKS